MLKYLTIATLICLPSFALASNVPFVGKREFDITPATGNVPLVILVVVVVIINILKLTKMGELKSLVVVVVA